MKKETANQDHPEFAEILDLLEGKLPSGTEEQSRIASGVWVFGLHGKHEVGPYYHVADEVRRPD